jgi:hypothetical protein
MGSLRAKLVDRNRYAKRYPLIRAPVRTTYTGDSDMAVEVGSIYFNNAESGTLTFDASFVDTNYQVIAVARNSGSETADVNVFVSDKSQTSITVQASSNFTGYVDVFAVRIG